MKDTINWADFSFKENETGMSLVSYTGNEPYVVFPDYFQGKPVTVIERSCLEQRSGIDVVVLPNTVRVLKSNAFMYSGVKKLILPEGLVEVGSGCFFGCKNLEEIIFPSTLEILGGLSFYACDSCRKVISKSLHAHVASEMHYCGGLKEVNFSLLKALGKPKQRRLFPNLLERWDSHTPEEQKEIMEYLEKDEELIKVVFFSNNSTIIILLLKRLSLLSLDMIDYFLENSIEKKNTTITAKLLDYRRENYSQEEIAAYSHNKEWVEIGLASPNWENFKNNWEYKEFEGGLCVTGYLGRSSEIVLPEKLEDGTKILEIHSNHSTHFEPLVKLFISEGIKRIASFSFRECDTLEEIYLPASLETIENDSFKFCKLLKKVILKNESTKFNANLFRGCDHLEFVGCEGGENLLPRFHAI